ncbi:MAG: SDR family oxidoreductase [Dongiaceae bacterium]
MKVALVTGASRGLGAEMARALAAAEWAVAVNYAHDTAAAAAVVTAIRESGGQAVAAQFDVTDAAAVVAGVADIALRLGPVDLIVNNATGPQPVVRIEEQTWEHYLGQLEFFLKAPVELLKAVLPDWRARKTGRIINIGSETVDIGSPKFAHYVAAKAAMVGLTRSWANELGPDGITVNLVAPGWTPVERHANSSPESLENHRRHVPLGRLGKPADVAAMVVFLASPGADYVTGQTIAVNGGRTLA